jgi:ABC-type glycerol-3-phosphate transport system permease component
MKAHPSRRRLLRRSHLSDAAVILLTLVGTVLVLFPIFWMVLASVRPVMEVLAYPPEWIPQQFTLEYYRQLFQDNEYVMYLRNSYVVAVGTTLWSLFLASLAAYGFSRYKVPGGRAILLCMLALYMMPGVSLVLPYFRISLGLHLYDTQLGLILAYSSFVLPMATWLLKGYMDSIPIDLEEAALVDGATRMGALRRILLPLIAPGLIATGTMGFLGAWNEYFFAVVLTTSIKAQTLTVGIGRFFGQYNRDWNGIMALTTFASLPLLLIFVLIQRWVVQGMTAGAVK